MVLLTDAQVGTVVGIVLADEELSTTSLRRLAKPLLARSTSNTTNITALPQVITHELAR